MLLAWLLLPAAAFAAEAWSIEKHFTCPFAWGTSPTEIAWSKRGHTLLFLRNAEGKQFRDLCADHPKSQTPIRLTNMESVRDAFETDRRRKRRSQQAVPNAAGRRRPIPDVRGMAVAQR